MLNEVKHLGCEREVSIAPEETCDGQMSPNDSEVASHPVERVGHPGEHQVPRGASTQVSLLPPPWEEFTT